MDSRTGQLDQFSDDGHGDGNDVIGTSLADDPSSPFEGDPYFEDAKDLFGTSEVDYWTYRLHIDKYRPLPDPCPPCGVISCPSFDYFPHLVHGGTVVKEPLPVPPPGYPNDGSYPESRGHTAVAILLEEGVVLAVNHHSSGPAVHDLIGLVGPRMIATISGGEVGECTKLLHNLQKKCPHLVAEISVEKTLQAMSDILSSRLEVGLIAGWDGATNRPFLYRVDGMGGLIKGDILATGSRFRALYGFLGLNDMIHSKRSFPFRSWLDGIVDDES